ncbi:Integrase catalytic region [Thioalkalivibrio sulfidiphilus HL-EbGr7]|uniref:Integrase catalytic region n=1 Tax=Thioalkalivibrio sulfidiphilus (strain HL-EbGR7) TaxID=396588 RepID=B8GUZ8_THISH|nr:Mu transposase C-terminal domain-containing protein [Thioalkalivibrio sulfidiphilus]ACL71509.1 Integrase catalytic region [Thioalkalivibrio sulfidiphilus HL-EbGr7]
MGNVIATPYTPRPLPQPARSDDEWARLPEYKRERAEMRLALIKVELDKVVAGVVSAKSAAQHLRAMIDARRVPEHTLAIAKKVGRAGEPPSWQSIERWLNGYRDAGMLGLVDRYKGRQRRALGCEARILYYLRHGAKNDAGNITKFLQQEGFDVTYGQVRRYIKTLPATETHHQSRVGQLEYNSRMRGYVRRATAHLPVGACYQSDGNLMPIHLAHPVTGKPWRPEMTPCLDVVSRYWVGYYIAESESAIGTMHALGDSIRRENHVPLDFQADNGPGFKAGLVQRFLENLGITPHHPRPRNPKDNGYVERFHGILKNECLKRLPGYCGKDANPDMVKAFLRDVRNKEQQLLTLAQFYEIVEEFRRWYNHERAHGEIDCAPAALWARLERNPPIDLDAAMFWDREERTVSDCRIRFANREYSAPELIQWNTKKVFVEFNLRSDAMVRVLDLSGRWICDAPRTKESPYRFSSIMEDRKQFNLRQRLKTIERNREEMEARAGLAVTHDQVLERMAELEQPDGAALEKKTGSTSANVPPVESRSEIELDILNTDY